MVIDGIKAEYDVPVYTHTCGSIGDRLELMKETGTNGIDTLDPPPLGSVHLSEAKERIGEALFIKGNIDPVNTILLGTPEQVFEEARRCISVAAKGGGYVLSSACSIPPQAPPENILMLHEAAERFGQYA
jgi:uroporphyrinogen decarboxylase